MPRKKPLIRDLNISVGLEKITADFPTKIFAHGDLYVVRIPMDQIKFYDLQSGDTLKVRILGVKRLRTEAEALGPRV